MEWVTKASNWLFENESAMSGGENENAVADSFTEDLSTLLAKISGYHVFARHTAFTFKGGSHDIQKIGESLGVRYAIEGSIHPAAEGIRVTVQLIETASGDLDNGISQLKHAITISPTMSASHPGLPCSVSVWP